MCIRDSADRLNVPERIKRMMKTERERIKKCIPDDDELEWLDLDRDETWLRWLKDMEERCV